MCGLAGLDLPPLSDHARDGIDGILKGFGWAANPADVTGFANSASFPSIMEYLLDEPKVGTLVIASAGADTQAEQVISLRQRTHKGIAFLWTGSRSETAGLAKLKLANIPVFYTPDTLARGLRRRLDYHAWRDRRLSDGFAEAPALSAEQHRAIGRLRTAARTTLSESESKQLIAAWGIPVTREVLASSAEAAVEAADDVAVRRCPLTLAESLAIISEVKGARLLRGFRGRPPADVAALADTLVHVSWLAVDLTGHLAELDINPLMVLPAGHGVKAVDALTVLPSP